MAMKKRKVNPVTDGLSSPDVEGQGTTRSETGSRKAESSRKKQKRS